jgi:uncharacterized protein YndB with AHSA1/START domain
MSDQPATSEAVASQPGSVAPVVRAVHVRRSPGETFRLFTERIGDWWPLHRYGVFEDATAGVWLEGDRVVERSTSGEESVWAEVLEQSPPKRLVLAWHPAQPADKATRVEVDFDEDDNGTRVVLTHTGWERLGDEAAEAAASYAGGWAGVLDGFVALAEQPEG